jgi:hypothetical protein
MKSSQMMIASPAGRAMRALAGIWKVGMTSVMFVKKTK